MTLLVLGGTAEGRQLATRLQAQGVTLIYSLAGLVRTPELDCEIVSGGFTRFGGLPAFIQQRRIRAILDATHPYAQGISHKAAWAAKACAIPCWRFQRPAWRPEAGDNWQAFTGWETLLPALRHKASVFLTAGQPDQRTLDRLLAYQELGQRQLLRTAVKPGLPLPPAMGWIQAIGPFGLEDERRIMAGHHIDALVSKNSGGTATAAKLVAARELGVPVFMLARPELPGVDHEFNEVDACEAFVRQWTANPPPKATR